MKPIKISKHEKIGSMEYDIELNVKLTLWTAIKMRIAGIYNILDQKKSK